MCEEAGVKISHSLRVSKLFNAAIPKKMIREKNVTEIRRTIQVRETKRRPI